MRTTSGARPDLAAYQNSLGEFTTIVAELQKLLGRKTVAYIAGVKDARAIDRWIDGKPTERDTEFRLRLAYRVAWMLHEREDASVIQAWFFGLNPALDERSPATLLREGSLKDDGPAVVAAAREFAAEHADVGRGLVASAGASR